MIEAFWGLQARRRRHIVDQIFHQRCDVYVKQRKWKGLVDDGGMERDEFDNDVAIYLAALDEEDTVLGSLRLLPTTIPHLFSEHFSQLGGPEGSPRGADVYELTRFYVSPDCKSVRQKFWLTGVLACGMFEYCLQNGVRKLTSVMDTFLLSQALEAGWRVRPLSLPLDYGEGTAVGVVIEISEEALEATRLKRGVRGPVLSTANFSVGRIPVDFAAHLSTKQLDIRPN